MISARPITPESGRPAAIDFATTIRSASTAKCSIANIRAVRPKPGLHLVGDEHDAVPVADRAQPCDERRGRGDEASLALLRLEHDRGHVLGGDVGDEHALELCQSVLRRHAAVRVRVGRAVDLGREGPETELVRHAAWTSSSATGACGRGRRPRTRSRPGRPVYRRANLTAFSTASVPALKNAARVGPAIGASAPSRSASST